MWLGMGVGMGRGGGGGDGVRGNVVDEFLGRGVVVVDGGEGRFRLAMALGMGGR